MKIFLIIIGVILLLGALGAVCIYFFINSFFKEKSDSQKILGEKKK